MATIDTDRFPYEKSRWGNPEHAKGWFEELEMIGPQNVRARLAQTDAGSAGAIAIGVTQVMTIGFAQEWLAWHDRRREAIEEARHRRTVFWTRWAAVAATVAGASAAIGWAWTILHSSCGRMDRLRPKSKPRRRFRGPCCPPNRST